MARLVISEEWPAGWAEAVETLKQAQADMLRATLLPNAPAAEANHHTFYSGDILSLHPLEPTAAVIAMPRDAIQPILARLEAQPDKTVTLPPISGANPALLDVYLRPAGLSGAFDDGMPPVLVALSKASHARVSFESANGLTVRLLAQFPDEVTARAGVDSVTPLLSQLDRYLEMCELNMPEAVKRFAIEYPGAEKLGPLLDQAIKAARRGAASATVKREGKAVSVVVSIQTSQPAADAVLLLSQLPRPAK